MSTKVKALFFGGPLSLQRVEVPIVEAEYPHLPHSYEYEHEGIQYIYSMHEVHYAYIYAQVVYIERAAVSTDLIEKLNKHLMSEIKEQ